VGRGHRIDHRLGPLLDGAGASPAWSPDGRIVSLSFDRWGDPDGTGQWGWHRFGGDITGHRRFGDLTNPRAGRVGWHHDTDRWPEGAFFEFTITSARPVRPGAGL
jgi:hypothetical protein